MDKLCQVSHEQERKDSVDYSQDGNMVYSRLDWKGLVVLILPIVFLLLGR